MEIAGIRIHKERVATVDRARSSYMRDPAIVGPSEIVMVASNVVERIALNKSIAFVGSATKPSRIFKDVARVTSLIEKQQVADGFGALVPDRIINFHVGQREEQMLPANHDVIAPSIVSDIGRIAARLGGQHSKLLGALRPVKQTVLDGRIRQAAPGLDVIGMRSRAILAVRVIKDGCPVNRVAISEDPERVDVVGVINRTIARRIVIAPDRDTHPLIARDRIERQALRDTVGQRIVRAR